MKILLSLKVPRVHASYCLSYLVQSTKLFDSNKVLHQSQRMPPVLLCDAMRFDERGARNKETATTALTSLIDSLLFFLDLTLERGQLYSFDRNSSKSQLLNPTTLCPLTNQSRPLRPNTTVFPPSYRYYYSVFSTFLVFIEQILILYLYSCIKSKKKSKRRQKSLQQTQEDKKQRLCAACLPTEQTRARTKAYPMIPLGQKLRVSHTKLEPHAA